MAQAFDIAVIGDDAPSLCAAAAGARAGAAIALISAPGKKGDPPASYCDVPNFVWRRLDLHEYGLSLAPISARVTLTATGATATYRSVRETQEALGETAREDALLWPSFVADMGALEDAAAALSGAAGPGATDLSFLGGGAAELSAFGRLSGACADILTDYYNGSDLTAHVSAHALGPLGLGADEAGSAAALPAFLSADAWRVRQDGKGPSLLATLKTVCEKSGVFMVKDLIEDVADEKSKTQSLVMKGGDRLRAGSVFLASPAAASRAGLSRFAGAAARAGEARAELRLKLSEPVAPAVGGAEALYQIVDNAGELQRARDAVADGRLPDDPPIEFEFAENGDLLARTAYCPRRFRDEEGEREWTGQDRQALMQRMIERLSDRLDGLPEKIRGRRIRVEGCEPPDHADALARFRRIVVQPDRHGAVGAAVRLMDRTLARG